MRRLWVVYRILTGTTAGNQLGVFKSEETALAYARNLVKEGAATDEELALQLMDVDPLTDFEETAV